MRRIDYTNALNARANIEKRTIPATGVDNIALPVTAANTGMQVQLFGQSAENVVVNGDFRNGTAGWVVVSASGVTVINGIVEFTPTKQYGSVRQTINNPNGFLDKWYLRALVKTDKSTVALCLQGQAFQYHSGSGNYEVLSGLKAVSFLTPQLQIQDLDTSGFTKIYAYNVMAINLTATFGAGNEPTKEQCDKLFANYFEGTANTIGTGRVRSVDADGENASILQITTPPLRSNGLIKDEVRKGANGYELVKRVGVGTLGDELITNAADREFTSDTGFWSKATGMEIVDGVLRFTAVESAANLSKRLLEVGKIYKLTFSIVNYTAGRVLVNISSYTWAINNSASSVGTHVVYFKARHTYLHLRTHDVTTLDIDNISIREVVASDVIDNSYFTEISGGTTLYTLATPVITPIAHAGLLNSNSNGTVYFEPAIKDIITYTDKAEISDTDYPISSIESIEKNGIAVNPATAVIAEGGLSLTHPDLEANDEVELIYFYNRESTGRGMRLLFYNKA